MKFYIACCHEDPEANLKKKNGIADFLRKSRCENICFLLQFECIVQLKDLLTWIFLEKNHFLRAVRRAVLFRWEFRSSTWSSGDSYISKVKPRPWPWLLKKLGYSRFSTEWPCLASLVEGRRPAVRCSPMTTPWGEGPLLLALCLFSLAQQPNHKLPSVYQPVLLTKGREVFP